MVIARDEDTAGGPGGEFTRSVAAGESIFEEGDPGTEMYIIQSGQVEILKTTGRTPRRLALLEEGDFFGEMAILEDIPRTASARAHTDCVLVRIDRSTFDQLVRHDPEIAIRMLRKLSSRLRMANPALLDAELGGTAPGEPEPEVPVERRAPGRSPGYLVHEETGQRFGLAADGRTTVGRFDPATGLHPDLDLKPLDVHRSTSRRHAVILERDGTFFVREEVGSANGTFVNGRRLQPGADVELHDGDRVQFGLVRMVFHRG